MPDPAVLEFPDKYLSVGIAEQNLIGIAAGLASENFNVLTTTFAPFQTMRCCEQIKVNLGVQIYGIERKSRNCNWCGFRYW